VDRKKLGWLVVGAAALCVVAASLVSPSVLSMPVAVSDKLYHAVAYFVLTLVALYIFDDEQPLVVAVGVVALGAGVEVAQSFVPYRTASLLDAVANAVGVAIALGVTWCAIRAESVRHLKTF
jgi:VanZ family protein